MFATFSRKGANVPPKFLREWMRAAIKQKAFSPFQHNYFIIHITRGKMIRPSRNSRTTPASKSKPKPKPQPQQTQQTKPAPPSQRPPADGIAYVSKKEVKREKEEEQEDQNLILQPGTLTHPSRPRWYPSGLILMRQFLSEEEQILVQKQIWEMGRRDRKAQGRCSPPPANQTRYHIFYNWFINQFNPRVRRVLSALCYPR